MSHEGRAELKVLNPVRVVFLLIESMNRALVLAGLVTPWRKGAEVLQKSPTSQAKLGWQSQRDTQLCLLTAPPDRDNLFLKDVPPKAYARQPSQQLLVICGLDVGTLQ